MVVYRLLADAVVVFHAAYVGFVIAGLLLVLVGAWFRWTWVHNLWFRWIHFSLIAIVVVETLFGVTCPLTTWEDALRKMAGEEVVQGTFIGRCAHNLLFYEAPEWVFTICYCMFGAMVLAAMVFVPPRRPSHRRVSPHEAAVPGA